MTSGEAAKPGLGVTTPRSVPLNSSPIDPILTG
jgi:hypothetical protein